MKFMLISSFTHQGLETQICVSDLGLSLINADLLSAGPIATNFNEFSIRIQTFSFRKIHMHISTVCQVSCSDLYVWSENIAFHIIFIVKLNTVVTPLLTHWLELPLTSLVLSQWYITGKKFVCTKPVIYNWRKSSQYLILQSYISLLHYHDATYTCHIIHQQIASACLSHSFQRVNVIGAGRVSQIFFQSPAEESQLTTLVSVALPATWLSTASNGWSFDPRFLPRHKPTIWGPFQ